MKTEIRLRKGTTSQHSTFTGADGEVTMDTEKQVAVVHDGSTAGGFPTLRADRPRGYTLSEHFLNTGTWTKSNKPDLKKIVVHVWGGGGGGGNDTSGGSGGGSGGHGLCELDVASLPDNVAVTVGAGGGARATGGQTKFGNYATANGGGGGGTGNNQVGGESGTFSSNAAVKYELGGSAGDGGQYSATAQTNYGWTYGTGGGPGGRRGNAVGVRGGGGGAAGSNGARGSVLVYEIYGE